MQVIDCDVHVRWRSLEELAHYMEEPWRTKLLRGRIVHPHNGYPNPTATGRRDAIPPDGGSPGSSPSFTVEDLIERYQMEYVVLIGESGQLNLSNMVNADAASALATAYNDWLVDRWFSVDKRFLGSIYVATQDPMQAAKEIDRVAGHPQFVQVIMGSGARFPYGQRYYYPIYEAAERHYLPVALHPFTEGSLLAAPPTAAGYPSYYIEYHTCITGSLQAHLVSLICEGVFERFPGLKFVFVEGGIGWVPPLLWRLDQNWKALRLEVPWVRRKPSEYVIDHVRFTTQPLEEPTDLKHLHQLLNMFPSDRLLLFSSDYPHWDFDSPTYLLSRVPPDLRQRVFAENARELYNL